MPEQLLNPRQHRFVQAIIKGSTQSAAYKAAGYRVKDLNSAGANANRLLRNDRIKAALAVARAGPMARAETTAETIVAELEEARLGAQADGQWSAAVAASIGKAKILGIMIDRKQVDLLVHKPALHSKQLELSEEEWQRQFDPQT